MSLLINQPPKLCFRNPVLARSSSPLRFCKELSSSYLPQTLPHTIVCADPCRPHLVTVVAMKDGEMTPFNNTESMKLLEGIDKVIGTANGWLADSMLDTIRIESFDPSCESGDIKFICCPHELVTLPHCQTQLVTNVALSSSSPEEEDCVVAVKFSGPQLSFCRPSQIEPKWINIRIANPCFFSSPVMFSKKYDLFRIPGSGGHLIGSWDPHEPKHTPQIQRLRFENIPKMTKTRRELLDSCYTSEHLVESTFTCETFLVKWYKKTVAKNIERMETEALMVFKIDEVEENAVYTQDIGDHVIFLTKSETFCVPASSFPHMRPNRVKIFDVDETTIVNLAAQNWNC